MKKIRPYLLLCLAVFATGCPKYKPSVDFKNKSSFVGKLNEHLKTQQTAYISALGSVSDGTARAKTIRNELIENALPYVDGAYMDFITDIEAGRSRANFIADVIELGSSAAVGITNGERSIQIIGIALTAFRGGRRSIDVNFFKEQTTPILINKMDGNRAKVRATILNREKEEVGTYSMGAAISDIVDYYNAGTLVRAFTELSKDTAVQTKQSEDNVLVLKGVPLSKPATQEFRDLSVHASDTLFNLKTSLMKDDEKNAATEKLQKIVAELEKGGEFKDALKDADVTSKTEDGEKLRMALVTLQRNARNLHSNDLLNKINQAIVDEGNQ